MKIEYVVNDGLKVDFLINNAVMIRYPFGKR